MSLLQLAPSLQGAHTSALAKELSSLSVHSSSKGGGSSAQSRASRHSGGEEGGPQVVGGCSMRQGHDNFTPLPGQRREAKGSRG